MKVWVPMISGRGLDITGGTLDKLESIPGFNVNLDRTRAIKQLERIGVFIGKSDPITPAKLLRWTRKRSDAPILLGGGRQQVDDKIDLTVGISDLKNRRERATGRTAHACACTNKRWSRTSLAVAEDGDGGWR
jgi:thymidine phosphorylase